MGKHYIPQKYLEKFQIPEKPGYIWLYDLKRSNKPSCASIAKVAQQKDYFDEEVEKILATAIETPSNQIMQKILDGVLPLDSERLQLSIYVGTMMKRVPHHRSRAMLALPAALDDTVAKVKSEIEELSVRKRFSLQKKASLLAEVDRVRQDYLKQPPPSIIREMYKPWPGQKIVDCILRMTWRVLISSTNMKFMTCDNPAFFFEGIGLGNPEAELILPISSTHVLHCCWQKASSIAEFRNVDDKTILEINRRIIAGATRFVFFHKDSDRVDLVRDSLAYRLNRINWV
jgi:hypothetical protein